MTLALASLAEAMKAPAPWFLPYLPVARRVLDAQSSGSVADALNAASGEGWAGMRFVEQTALPEGEPYEAFIFRTGCVPTRDNLHDLFNGLMWLTYPKTKRRLNVLQADEIKLRGGANGARGPLRDALTLFDENAAILQAPVALIDALRARQWQVLFEEQRAQWQSAHLRIFGHALLEKLQLPRKVITAHVWVIADLTGEAVTDEELASSLGPERLAAKDFLPLPVLGVPGWWPANEVPGFYDDADVFRQLRR